MLRFDTNVSGWRGVFLVSITYVYFLIFAQFAFLKRLAELDIGNTDLKAVMAAMAVGGILFSLLAPRLTLFPSPALRIRVGLIVCSGAAILTLFPLGFSGSIAVSFLIGTGLGLLTVTLVADLRQWIGNRNALMKVGIGTGIAYLVCNLPALFTGSPQVQAATAALLCLAGSFTTLRHDSWPAAETIDLPRSSLTFLNVLFCFTALVWLDSAAFFIVQNTPSLKTVTWEGPIHLWTNGVVHFAAALASAWLLSRRGLWFVLTTAFLALGFGCLLLVDAHLAIVASVLYPIGVSFYSVALVAYPALIAPAASAQERARRAGWIYAIAGWCGSAMGIGMGQNLGHVPPAFVLCAGALVLLPWMLRILRQRTRELAAVAVVLLAAFYINRIVLAVHASPSLNQVERGRLVYISEGCINCHSQYVRPNSPDVLLWGPAGSLEVLRHQRPPLIGNRRQGPDLAEVGGRRSQLWLKAHFYDPPEVSGASIMPSYAFLFGDNRGNDLVAYLASLHSAGTAEHQFTERTWRPSVAALSASNSGDGERLFQRHCATCHSKTGYTRLTWQSNFKRLPPDLQVGPYYYLPPSEPAGKSSDRLAQIVKFGIPGTDMPGHEYFSDQQVASISLWLSQIIAQPNRHP